LQETISFYNSLDNDYFIKSVNTNVIHQQKLFNKFVPLGIKIPLINLGYRLYGEILATISFSNYGLLKFPQVVQEHIDRLESSNGVAKTSRIIEASAVTFNKKTVLTFCTMSRQTEVQKFAFKHLVDLGCKVKVDTNF
jgi:hypothetical protein